MKDDPINEDNATFERLDMLMQHHLKPLFIRAKVENVCIHKVLVDRGTFINIMPAFFLRKIGKYDTDLKPDNMVLSNYEGKTIITLGVIQVDMVVGNTSRPNFFMAIPTKANYNLLFSREWIHRIGGVPLMMHKKNHHMET